MQQKQSPVDKQIHYNSLTAPVTSADIQTYLVEGSKQPQLKLLERSVLVVGIILAAIALVNAAVALFSPSPASAIIYFIFAAIGGLIVWCSRFIERMYATSTRLNRFARDNGWYYQPVILSPSHQGLIFGHGHSRVAHHVIYLAGDSSVASFEMGNYQYTTGSGKNQQTHDWFYACVELDRNLPNMVLDAKKNNVSFFGKSISSNLPASLKGGQVLSLEGDFDKHFTLYAPAGYERDALYVFTPDLMALLIDEAGHFDAEVVDNKFYIYARPGTKAITNPQFVYQVLRIIHTVGMKIHRQTDYYMDEAAPSRQANVVAAHGQRLKQGIGWGAIILVIIIVAIAMIPSFI